MIAGLLQRIAAWSRFTPLRDAQLLADLQAVEEAIVNALVAAETMTGVHGNVIHALPHDPVREILRRHGRLEGE